MSILDLFKKNKKQIEKDIICNNDFSETNEGTVNNVNIPKRYAGYEKLSINDLCESRHTFWKFTQSEEGKSHEEVFAIYDEGNITVAQDNEEWLSFVKEENIGKCIGYGDRLTMLEFSENDEDIKRMKNEPIIDKRNMFGEMTAKNLKVKEHYSLEDPKTIVSIIKMSSDSSIQAFFYSPFSNIENVLCEYGFNESLKFAKLLRDNYRLAYPDEIELLRQEVEDVYLNWKDKNQNKNPLDSLDEK